MHDVSDSGGGGVLQLFSDERVRAFGGLHAVTDFAALEYVRSTPDAYVVHLHAVTGPDTDPQVEAILNKYGAVFHKKNVRLNFNGYVNLKKLSYGFDFFTGRSWIGSPKDGFAGARKHAKKSFGNNPLRAYVFVCDDLDKVRAAKKEIRVLYDIGNLSVHINDSHAEAVRTAETFFNENSLYVFNNRPWQYGDEAFDILVDSLKRQAAEQGADLDDFCAGGSAPFSVLGIRSSRDLDYLYCGDKPFVSSDPYVSSHDSQLRYYPLDKAGIIRNPAHHFHYNGLKFITLDILRAMKSNRNEQPKDVNDCALIRSFQKGKRPSRFVFFRKDNIGDIRKITFCNFQFKYRRKKRKR